MTDTKQPIYPIGATDDISDEQLEAITHRMIKAVMARKAIAQRKLNDELAAAMLQAETYFNQPKAS
ncbi:hypothetical protein [Candidatus Thiothrix anitrata]|uniref:Uncharacterized protein n=1 Tax=Candidatus Thiothrix anitrata TaxID=2823902 RepID=A0ABX7X136_9GAMM|nr:hypothetical protein [Candidatus Thiothrix anitrata]QTR49624.1 hypothetical protein J8380_15515 [Candidatus Thiothrix anitrata]